MDGENGAGSQLHHPIGCRTKHCYIQGATATYAHTYQVDLRFQGELNDLRVWFSDPHRRLSLEALASFRWNQSVELLRRSRYGFFRLGWPWNLLQHVQQGEFGIALCCRGDRIFQSPLCLLGEIPTEKKSTPVMD